MTDDLARRASRGEERALERIYRDYHQPLYRYCLAIVGNPADAQDALQNTMVKMLRSLPGEERSIALKPWLYRVAHNEAIDLLRRRRPNVSLDANEPQLGEELAKQVETRQRLRHLIADLGTLPERQRETLLMREAAGLSFEEIGEALETSPAVARQTLYEARLGLREMDAGREMKCDVVTKALSDGDGRVRRRRDIRAHLRDCGQCSRFVEEIESRSGALAAIAPLPAVAAAAMLQGLLGGGAAGGAAAGAGTGAGGVGGLLGGATLKSVGTATLLKGAATVAVVAAVGVGAADRAGLIHLGGGSSKSQGESDAASRPVSEDAPAGEGTKPSSTRSGEGTGAARASLGRADSVSGDTGRAVAPAADASGSAAAPEAAPSEPAPADSESESAATAAGSKHPHGRGHAKQTPAAAAHGQETAASHKPDKTQSSSGSGAGAGKTKSPASPATPAAPMAPASPPAAPSGPANPSPPGAESKAQSPPATPPSK